MKNQTLSIEQMKHLKELGVYTSKASMVFIATDDDSCPLDWETALEVISAHLYEVSFELFDAESIYYDHSYRDDCGVFTLQDIIDALPKEIKSGTDVFRLTMFVIGEMWTVCYSMSDEFDYYKEFESKSLLNAYYEMLCWCAENGYLNKQ